MAAANRKNESVLFLDTNVKAVKLLAMDLVRFGKSYETLNGKFETNLKMADSSCSAFQTQSIAHQKEQNLKSKKNQKEESKDDADAWTAADDLCLKNLSQMRECEENMMMYQDEKVALLQAHIGSLEAYICKMTSDLDEFKQLLQPNMISLPFPDRKYK